jgi:hypothetical protein
MFAWPRKSRTSWSSARDSSSRQANSRLKSWKWRPTISALSHADLRDLASGDAAIRARMKPVRCSRFAESRQLVLRLVSNRCFFVKSTRRGFSATNPSVQADAELAANPFNHCGGDRWQLGSEVFVDDPSCYHSLKTLAFFPMTNQVLESLFDGVRDCLAWITTAGFAKYLDVLHVAWLDAAVITNDIHYGSWRNEAHTLSKRAPSTTRPSLRLESVTYGCYSSQQSANCVRPPNVRRSLTVISSITAEESVVAQTRTRPESTAQ